MDFVRLAGFTTQPSGVNPANVTFFTSAAGCRVSNCSDFVSLRSKSLALHAVRSRSINSDTGEDGEEQNPDNISSMPTKPLPENQEEPATERIVAASASTPQLGRGTAERGRSRERDDEEEEQDESDKLFIHLRDNMETIREFCQDMRQQIPTPEQCVIEGNRHKISHKSCTDGPTTLNFCC